MPFSLVLVVIYLGYATLSSLYFTAYLMKIPPLAAGVVIGYLFKGYLAYGLATRKNDARSLGQFYFALASLVNVSAMGVALSKGMPFGYSIFALFSTVMACGCFLILRSESAIIWCSNHR